MSVSNSEARKRREERATTPAPAHTEPTAEDVFTWLRGHGWHDDRAEWLVVIQDVLDARAALVREQTEDGNHAQ